MKFDRRVQRQVQIAARIAFGLWIALLAAMFVGSNLLHKNPTSLWLGLFGPLVLVFATDQIVNSDWHSTTWTAVERSPDFYVRLGILALVLGVGITIAGVATGLASGWFH